MSASKTITRQLENASWIRRMFEEGVRLKRERGADAVFDYSLGNPDVEPPPAVMDALRRVVSSACREFDAGGVLDSPAPAGLPEAPLRYPEAPAVWRVYPCPEYWIPLESPPRWRAPAFIRRPIPYFRRRPRGGVQEPTRRRTSGLRAHTPRLPDRWPG